MVEQEPPTQPEDSEEFIDDRDEALCEELARRGVDETTFQTDGEYDIEKARQIIREAIDEIAENGMYDAQRWRDEMVRVGVFTEQEIAEGYEARLAKEHAEYEEGERRVASDPGTLAFQLFLEDHRNRK